MCGVLPCTRWSSIANFTSAGGVWRWCFFYLNHKTNTAAVGTAIVVRRATLARGGGRLCGRRASGGGGAAAVACASAAASGLDATTRELPPGGGWGRRRSSKVDGWLRVAWPLRDRHATAAARRRGDCRWGARTPRRRRITAVSRVRLRVRFRVGFVSVLVGGEVEGLHGARRQQAPTGDRVGGQLRRRRAVVVVITRGGGGGGVDHTNIKFPARATRGVGADVCRLSAAPAVAPPSRWLGRLRRHIELLTRTAAAVRCDVGGGPQAARCSRSRCSGARAAGAARAGAAAAAAAAAVAHEISYTHHFRLLGSLKTRPCGVVVTSDRQRLWSRVRFLLSVAPVAVARAIKKTG